MTKSVTVITYGTFDLFHAGHRRLLERARALGDHLIVGVTSEAYDTGRGKLNVQQRLVDRINQVQQSGLADHVIVEDYDGQKINDIQEYGADIFAIGSDWRGKFDYLNDYCKVVYLERTRGVSSTELRAARGILRLGIVGTGRIAHRFVHEAAYVSGVEIVGVYSRNAERRQAFVACHELGIAAQTYPALLDAVDAVYIATPHHTHAELAGIAINRGKHVLCEKPMALSEAQCRPLLQLAAAKDVVLLEAIKTAFAPGFLRLIALARSGLIGDIRSVDATFTKLVAGSTRELDPEQAGGSLFELGSYPLLAIVKLLGQDVLSLTSNAYMNDSAAKVDLYTRIDLRFAKAIASARVGLGVKAEGDLVIAGTRGYIYVPAPWWKTEYFELRFEDITQNRRFYFKFDGDGLRYELALFCKMIKDSKRQTFQLLPEESAWIAKILHTAKEKAQYFG